MADLFPDRIIQFLKRAAADFEQAKAVDAATKGSKKIYRQVSSPSNDAKVLVRLPDPVDLPIEQRDAFDCIGRFAIAILNTTMDWRDNLQAVAPGYRDRIASEELCPDEGGLNLNMPDRLIEALSARGQVCGQELSGFDFSQHAFTRYRIALGGLEEYLTSMDRSFQHPLVQDKEGWEYIKDEKISPHYAWPGNGTLAEDAAKAMLQIHDLLERWEGEGLGEHMRFSSKAPKPKSVLQSRPDF